MKILKTIISYVLFFVLIACNNSPENSGKANDELNKLKIQKEINTLDSISKEVEKTKNEIEESSKKLDELLNDI